MAGLLSGAPDAVRYFRLPRNAIAEGRRQAQRVRQVQRRIHQQNVLQCAIIALIHLDGAAFPHFRTWRDIADLLNEEPRVTSLLDRNR